MTPTEHGSFQDDESAAIYVIDRRGVVMGLILMCDVVHQKVLHMKSLEELSRVVRVIFADA